MEKVAYGRSIDDFVCDTDTEKGEGKKSRDIGSKRLGIVVAWESGKPTGMPQVREPGKGNGSYQTDTGVLALLSSFIIIFPLSARHQWRKSGVLQQVLLSRGRIHISLRL